MSDPGEIEGLLAAQRAYYSEIAAGYGHCAIPGWKGEDLDAALEAFRPAGDILELACGTGIWTERMERHARSLTAVDASAEMLELARARVQSPRVRFVQADIFGWEPDGRYDAVVFCFWLSHVPLERFDEFWDLVGRALKDDGRVFFADDAHRTPEELVDGESGQTVRRSLSDGSTRTIFKVPHEPAGLERRLASIGWRISVRAAEGPFFWGQGSPAPPAPSAPGGG